MNKYFLGIMMLCIVLPTLIILPPMIIKNRAETAVYGRTFMDDDDKNCYLECKGKVAKFQHATAQSNADCWCKSEQGNKQIW